MKRIKSLTGCKYPWDKWLDGGAYELVAGRDFHCSPRSLKVLIYATAAKRRLRVRAIMAGHNIRIQNVGRKEGAP